MALHTGDSVDTQQATTQNSQTLQAQGAERLELPSSAFITDASMTRDGNDLVLQTPDGQTLTVEGYFSADPAPTLVAADGSALTPNLVDAFAHSPMEYAANETASDASPVGAIEEVKGNATVTRTDGTVETITAGTPIYEGDIIETDAEGAVNIVFLDETSMAISQNAKIAVDEYTFDPSTESGTTNLSVLRGLFVFTSGQIGRDDPDDVSIDTPVGSIGIRGTIIAGEIKPGGESNISVLEGAIVVKNGAMETTLSDQFETVKLTGFDAPMKEMGVVPAAEINTKFNSVGTVLPSLFSVIHDAAQEQGQPTQQNQQAPQQQTAPSEDGAQNNQQQQTTEPVQQAQPAAESPVGPAPVTEIVTLDNKTANNLPSSQTVTGQPSVTGVSGDSMISATSPTGPMPGSTGMTGAPSTGTALPPPPPPTGTNTGTTAPPPFTLSVAMSNLLDTADAGFVVGTITSSISTGVAYTFANGLTTSSNGYFSLTHDAAGTATVRLTSLGADKLGESLDTIQLGGFGITATNNGRTVTTSVNTIVHDANTVTPDLTNPATVGVTHVVDNIDNMAGYSISALGDVNNDGFDDVIFSNNAPVNGQNHVYILHGQTGQWADGSIAGTTPPATGNVTTILAPSGTSVNSLDTIVTGIGDFNGDGRDDYALGQSNMTIGGLPTGNAYIVDGTSGNAGTPPANEIHFNVGNIGDGIGASISAVGDYNNDGYADVIVGAPGALSGKGQAYLMKGSNTAWGDITSLTQVTAIDGETSSGFGQSLRGVGDMNGDGYSDFAVGAAGGAGGNGYVDIFYGNKDGTTTGTRLPLGATGQGLGSEILALGDINGDGYSDIMISGNNASSARIVMGGAAGSSDFPMGDAVYKVNGAGGIGDFNGDGYDDFVVSLADSTHSKLYVVLGKDSASAPVLSYDYLKDPNNAIEFVYNGANKTDPMLEITGVGDLNGDGRDDFAIGVPDLNGANTGDGGLMLVYGHSRPAEITTGNQAQANGDSLLGTGAANTMDDMTKTGVSFRSGAGNDIINLTNSQFQNIDGGSGLDIIKANQSLDFSAINYEQISGIEKIQFGSANTTIKLTMENIFNLLKTSDNFFDGSTHHAGYLKISADGLAGAKLLLDADIGGSTNASATQIDSALESYSGSGTVTTTDTAGAGNYDTFKIGGYTLLIDNAITVDVV